MGQEYRLRSDHVEDLSDGKILEPGEAYDLTYYLDDPRVEDLIAQNKLLLINPAPEVLATDAAITLAKENGIPLASISGSGADGKIIQSDVESHIKAQEGGTE